jgi:uncharacterized membrane protein YphA (DoxX/SURF4 family)
MNSSKLRTVGYWATTGLIALDFAMGGVMQLVRPPAVVEGMTHLGYPGYFVTLLGVWKLLGAIALLAPRFPLLKEWAYAGMFFDMTSAVVSHYASGDGVAHASAPLLFVAILVASWALRPESRRLPSVSASLPRHSPRSSQTLTSPGSSPGSTCTTRGRQQTAQSSV